MNKLAITLAISIASGVLMASESPTLIPFQGRLTDQQGVPYTNAQYSVTFNIYDVPAGSSSLWTERHEKVGVVNGMINVFLGSITPLPGSVDFSKTCYLGITIDSDHNPNSYDPEMVPRQLIIAPHYAKNSGKLNGADWSAILADGATDPVKGYVAGARLKDKSVTLNKLADGIITEGFVMPAGVIMPFAGPADKIPDGWLLCNGQTLSQSEHARLFERIGHTWSTDQCDRSKNFNLPNFTNRTLWGANTQNAGTYLAPALPNVTFADKYLSVSWSNPIGALWNGEGSPMPVKYETTSRSASSSSGIYKDGCTTVQPPAACVNFIIKD